MASRSTGHVPDAIRASEAVAAGQRTFEHLIGIFEASTPDEDAFITRHYGAGKDSAANKSLAAFLDRYDAAREANIIQLLAANTRVAMPDAVLGARAVARGRDRLHEGSGHRVHAAHVGRRKSIRRCRSRSPGAWTRTR